MKDKKIFALFYAYLPILFLLGGVAAWLLNFFPGFHDLDIAYAFNSIKLGYRSPWHSYLYSAILDVIWTQTQSITPLLLLQIGSFTAASLWLVWKMLVLPRRLSWLFIFMLFYTPIHANQIMAFLRDSTFSALLPFLFILLFSLKYQPEDRFRLGRLLTLAVVTGLLSGFRLDALILVPCVLALVFWQVPISAKEKGVFTTSLLLTSIFFTFGLQVIPQVSIETNSYKLTSFVHPLSAVAHHGTLTAEEEATIEAVISVEALRRLYNPYQITPYHQVGAKKFSKLDFQKLTDLVPTILWNNLGVVLESRYRMALANLGFEFYMYSRLSGSAGDYKEGLEAFKTLQLDRPQDIGQIGRYYSHIELWAYNESLINILYYSALPFFFLSFLILRSYRQNPFASYLLLLCWIRVPAIFLLAPGVHMKYMYPFYIGTLFCFFLAKIERLQTSIK